MHNYDRIFYNYVFFTLKSLDKLALEEDSFRREKSKDV